MKNFILRLTKKYPGLVSLLAKSKWIRRFISQRIINGFGYATHPRPRPFSLASSYTSWKSLTEKSYTGRHLPEAERIQELPTASDVARLWARTYNREIPSEDTSLLFSFFAQWFVDSFLRSDPYDKRLNDSNHEIDLCQLYGLNESKTRILRKCSEGKLKYQLIDGEVYPPYLFDPEKTSADNFVFAPGFEDLHSLGRLKFILQGVPQERLRYTFALGLEHGNSSIGYTTICTLMLREHNRLCDEIIARNPDWKDERIFETVRNIMIVILIKIVARDYIGHIAPIPFPLELSPGMAENQSWYRSNWISLEFNLLYRWHSLVPDHFTIGDSSLSLDEYRNNAPLVPHYGIGRIIDAASRQRVGRIGLKNTPQMFFNALSLPLPNGSIDTRSILQRSVDMSREFKLRSYNEYRLAFGLEKTESFENLVGNDSLLAQELRTLYSNQIDDVEWLVGIYAEKHDDGAMLGELMTTMVAYDAFTHALTNPLLSKRVFSDETFTSFGLATVEASSTFSDIVARNVSNGSGISASFTTLAPPPGSYGLPVIGVIYETLDFLFFSGWKIFFLKRQARYRSTVFKVNVFMKSIAITDPDGFEPLFNWDSRMRKDYGFGWAVPPPSLVGNIIPSVFQDDPEHARFKELYIAIVKDNTSSLPATFDEIFANFSKEWLVRKNFKWGEEIERFCAAFVFQWYFGGKPNIDGVRYLYSNLFAHKPLTLLKLIPWSRYNKSIPIFEELLEFVKESPKFGEHLAHANRLGIEDTDVIAKQMLFMCGMNNFLGLQGMSKALIGELSARPELCIELRTEIKEASQSSEQDRENLLRFKLPLLDNVIKEVMRLHPPVFFIHGRAERDFVLSAKLGDYSISKGDHLMGVVPIAQMDEHYFEAAEEFRPERFCDKDILRNLIWPHGSHNAEIDSTTHICPGKDVSMVFARLLACSLLKGYEWELDSKPRWSDRKFSLNVAAPVGNLAVSQFRERRND